jgi:D-inositol-3-phosphate glycosyltransferase
LYRANRRKIVIVSPGVDVSLFHPLPAEEARRQIGLPEDVNILLSVGRIEPLKAIDTVIRALAIICVLERHIYEHLRYVVVGGNLGSPIESEMMRLKALAHELAVNDHVDFVGAKDQSKLALYYSAASVVVMPSDYESFGMVALEAMASGTPVIASAVGGLAYLVKDGETGYLVPSREPEVLAATIVKYLKLSAAGKIRMRKAALALAGRYTWVEVADSLVLLFEELLQNGEASRHKN